MRVVIYDLRDQSRAIGTCYDTCSHSCSRGVSINEMTIGGCENSGGGTVAHQISDSALGMDLSKIVLVTFTTSSMYRFWVCSGPLAMV